MTVRGHPHPDSLPIPDDIVVGPGWTRQMIEMADHIGPHATLLVMAAAGGEYLYIAEDPDKNVLRDIVGPEKARILSHVYGRERLHLPTAREALRFARRQPIIAAVRAKHLTISEAARMLGSTHPYVSRLVNKTTEGTNAVPAPRPQPRTRALPGQLDMFGE